MSWLSLKSAGFGSLVIDRDRSRPHLAVRETVPLAASPIKSCFRKQIFFYCQVQGKKSEPEKTINREIIYVASKIQRLH
jgi:hypothetical protein